MLILLPHRDRFHDYIDCNVEAEGAALYGRPEEIMTKLEALRAAGVTYVLANIGGSSRESLRRFAREIAPAFTDRNR